MTTAIVNELRQLLEILDLDEFPMALLFGDQQPDGGFSPVRNRLPSVKEEEEGTVDMAEVFKEFSCAMGHIWRARKKRKTAWFSAEHWGCLGGAYWMGFNKPQLDCIVKYVSQGERYCDTYESMRKIFDSFDPEPIPSRYLIFKPFDLLEPGEEPVFVTFFVRPESLSGLHQLAMYVTNDIEVVQSPWGAGCSGLVSWPMKYMKRGTPKAVLGGWDPSARQFYKTDELSFTVPYTMFMDMVQSWDASFLSRDQWVNVRKKIDRSRRAWGEIS